jgi:hypothetical protein
MELTQKQKGNLSEMKIAAKLMEYGYTVCFPYGENTRFDLIFECNSKLYKVQVKTGRYDEQTETITISCRSNKCYINLESTENRSQDYKNDVDYIGTYCPQLDKCYMIPINVCGKAQLNLRVGNSQKTNQHGTNYASHYQI